VENLFKKYESNPYMVSRLTNILTAQLPGGEHRETVQRAAATHPRPDHHSGRVYPAVLSTNNLFYCEKTEFFFTTTGLNTLSTTKTTYCT
jgi:hypothetical protein